jgi:hypothetical protein
MPSPQPDDKKDVDPSKPFPDNEVKPSYGDKEPKPRRDVDPRKPFPDNEVKP